MGAAKPTLAVACGLAAIGLLPAGAGAGTRAARIPPSVRAQLRGQALRAAAEDGDRHPYDIQAVRTTAGEAERITCGRGCSSNVPPPGTPIYLIALRGRFWCNTCSHPPGAGVGRGSVITLEIPLAASLSVSAFGFGGPYPNLRAAGIPVRL